MTYVLTGPPWTGQCEENKLKGAKVETRQEVMTARCRVRGKKRSDLPLQLSNKDKKKHPKQNRRNLPRTKIILIEKWAKCLNRHFCKQPIGT